MGNGGFSWWTPDISCSGSWTCWPKNIIWYAAVPSCSLYCLYRKDSIPNRLSDLFSSQRKEVFSLVHRLGSRVGERGWSIVLHFSRQPLTLLIVTVLLYLCNLDFFCRIRHFPIELTPSGRYVIGKHAFDGLTEIVTFYKQNALFYTQNKNPVTLGDSFRGM